MKKLALTLMAGCMAVFGSSAQTLRLHYDFDNVVGSTATDLSPLGLNGTINGCTPVPGCSGLPNTALRFGAGRWVQAPADPRYNLTTWTVSAIVRVNNFNMAPGDCQVSKILQHGSQYTSNYYAMELNDNGIEVFNGDESPCGTVTPGGQQLAAAAAMNIPSGASYNTDFLNTGVWYCLTATYDDAVMRYYVNGNLVHSYNWPQGYNYNPSNSPVPILIGRGTGQGGSTYFFDGDIDDVKVFQGALSAAQVAALCPNCAPPPGRCSVDDIRYSSSVSTPFVYTFSATANPGSTCVEWDFGDGSPVVTSTPGSSVTHTFPGGGHFNICATGYDCITGVRCPGTLCFPMCIDPSSGAKSSGGSQSPTPAAKPGGLMESIGEPYPNPTTGILSIPVGASGGKATVSVYDALGALISQNEADLTSDQVLRLSTQNLRPGSYVAEITANGETVRKRFTKL